MTNDRTISICGAFFAVATLIGLAMMIEGVASGDATNVEAAEWLAKSGNRAQMIIAMYVMAGGAIAFAVFASAVIRRLRAAGAPDLAVDVARIGAAAYTALVLASAVAMASGAYSLISNNEAQPLDPGVARTSTLGFAIWVFPAAFAGSVFVASVSVAAMRSAALPRWLCLIGLLVAVLLLFGISFLPTFSILIWALCVSIVAFVRRAGSVSVQAAPQPA
ncbi:hypothetical protein AYO38_00360 [bacterium SCGC AG-212-C10]|nr:hypothetical protein AYO38_00360 [bacterium SCGC AG-212-C10]